MLRLTQEDYDQIHQKAEKAEIGLAEFCRRSALNRDILPKADLEMLRQLSRVGNNINQIARYYHQHQNSVDRAIEKEKHLKDQLIEIRNLMRRSHGDWKN